MFLHKEKKNVLRKCTRLNNIDLQINANNKKKVDNEIVLSLVYVNFQIKIGLFQPFILVE